MGKLAVPAFNRKFRFRDSRSFASVANCRICAHNADGYCVHPERSRLVILSTLNEFDPKGERNDWSCWKVCDVVQVVFPEGIIIPDLPEGHVVITSPGRESHAGVLEHTDPRCPYIAAMIRDDGLTEYGGQSIRIADRSGARHSDNPCELPGCRQSLPPPWRPDGYLSSQGFDDGYVPNPPKSLDDGQPAEPLSEHELMMRIGPYAGGSIRINWTEETIEQAARLIKRLIFPRYTYDPKTKTYDAHPLMDWSILSKVLPLVGWEEIVARIDFEWAVKVCELVYCINCGLHPEREARIENPVRGTNGQPRCPICHSPLNEWGIFIQFMPE